MRVGTVRNPHTYQQQRTHGNGKDKGFADMLIGMAYNKHGKPEKQAKLDKWSFNTHKVNPHKDHGTQIKPDKEWLNTVGQPNAESKGDKELTGSQIHFLQSHYDVENLTPEARRDLLCDLADMGVLSAADINSDDQTKVDGVLEQIKAFKLLKWSDLTLVEFPEQPEAIMCDYSDPEFRGMSDDEKFAAIFKKYDGGTHITSFMKVTMALHRNRLLTKEQSEVLLQLAMGDYVEKRDKISPSAMPGHLTMEQVKYDHYVTMRGLLKQTTKFEPYKDANGKTVTVDMTFLEDFVSKFEALY